MATYHTATGVNGTVTEYTVYSYETRHIPQGADLEFVSRVLSELVKEIERKIAAAESSIAAGPQPPVDLTRKRRRLDLNV